MPSCPKCDLPYEQGIYCGRCGARLPHIGKTVRPTTKKSNPVENQSNNTAEEEPPQPPSHTRQLDSQNSSPSSHPVSDEISVFNAQVKKNPSSPEVYFQLAEALLQAGKAEKALSTFRAVKALSPEDPQVFRLGAKIYEVLGRSEDAIKAVNKVLSLDPHDLETALHSAKLLREAGMRQQSLEQLQTLRSRADEKPEVLLRLAELELSLDDPAAAQQDLWAYRKAAGETREMSLLLGKAMLAQNFNDGAVKHYQDALNLFPNDPDLGIGLGKAFLGLNERGKAVLEFERALIDRPDNLEILLEMGKLYNDMGMDEKGDEMFERIRRQTVRDGDIFLRMADYFLSRNWTQRALEDLERARAIGPHNPDIIKALGTVFETRGAPEKALLEYESYLEGMPRTIWALQGIVRCACKNEDFPRVAKAQKVLIEAGQNHPDAWCDYAEILIRLGDFEAAEKAFEQASRLDPTCVRAYQAPELIRIEKARAEGEKLFQKAKEAISKKFFLSAIEKLDRALDLVPREISWLALLAEVNIKIGSLSRASELLSKVRAARPQEYWAGFQLARIYEFEEKSQLAIELLASLLKDHPTDIEANLAILRLKRGQIKGERFERESLSNLIRLIHAELAELRKKSPIPLLIEAYANFIFGAGTKFQPETMKRAEQLFEEILAHFENSPWAHRGLALVYRVLGEEKKAVHHLEEWVKLSSDPQALFALARLHENFQSFTEARKCYSSLKNLFPDNGHYRRKIVEMLAKESEGSGKNELMDFLATCQERVVKEKSRPWFFYEMAWAQTMVARRSPQRDEWSKRALLTWHKGNALPEPPMWLRWGLLEAQLEFLKGPERLRTLNQNIKACEKIVREHPDVAWAHTFMGICHLGFEDLAQTDQAVKYLETGAFLDPQSAEIALLLGKTYRQLGKTVRVDAIRHHMLLLEPELMNKL